MHVVKFLACHEAEWSSFSESDATGNITDISRGIGFGKKEDRLHLLHSTLNVRLVYVSFDQRCVEC